MGVKKLMFKNMLFSHPHSSLNCRGDEIDIFCKIICGPMFDKSCRADSENICVGSLVIVGCPLMYSMHGAGVTESLKDSFDIFSFPRMKSHLLGWNSFKRNIWSGVFLLGRVKVHSFTLLIWMNIDILSMLNNSSHFSVLLSGLFLFLAFAMLYQSLFCSDARRRRLSSDLFVFLDRKRLCRSTAGHFIYRWHTSDEENYAILTMVIVVTLSLSICMCCVQWLIPSICMLKTSDMSLSHSRQAPHCERSQVVSSLSWGYGHLFDIMRSATVSLS